MVNSKTAVESGGKGKTQHYYIEKPQEVGRGYCLPASTADMLLETRFLKQCSNYFPVNFG